MKMMKKTIALIMTLLMIFCSFVGCSFFVEEEQAKTDSLSGNGNTTVYVGQNNEVAQVRSVQCSSCHGNKLCWHCNGDCFRNGRRCNVCDGNGNCTACLGKGVHEVLVINGQDYVYCTACHGKKDCTMCNGSGKDENYNSDCFNCKGSRKCPYCKGEGITRLRGF